jgi:hypothetical protein
MLAGVKDYCGKIPLWRLSAVGCVGPVVGSSFHMSSIPRTAGLVPGGDDRGDPVVLFAAEFSCDLSSMFIFVTAAVMAGISFCVVVIKTCSSSLVGLMWNVYCLTNDS